MPVLKGNMNNSSCTCKCMKKIRNIEVITYNYDPKCLAKLKDQRKNQSSHQEDGIWKPLENIVGKKLCDFKALQCLFTSKSSNRDKLKTINQSKYEQKSTATLSKECCEKFSYNMPIKHNAGSCPVKTRTDSRQNIFNISKTRKFGWKSEIVSSRPRSQ